MEKILLPLPEDWLEAIDNMCGETSRVAFIRQALRNSPELVSVEIYLNRLPLAATRKSRVFLAAARRTISRCIVACQTSCGNDAAKISTVIPPTGLDT